MAKSKRINFNIDKLKLCFSQNENTYSEFNKYRDEFEKKKKETNKKTPIFIDKGDYVLAIIDFDIEHILVKVFINNECLGKFIFNDSKKCEGLCFFEFENKALYSFLTCHFLPHQQMIKVNLIPLIIEIAADLQLQFHNITTLEVALDANFNITAKISKMIRDYESFDMFVNGKRISNPKRKIDNFKKIYSCSRVRLMNSPTLYFEQAKTDAPVMRIYNKTNEIEDNDNEKDYIKQWNDFGNDDIHRVEIRVKSQTIKEFLATLQTGTLDNTLNLLTDPAFLYAVWNAYCNRLLRFRHSDGTDITIADLCD